MARYSGELRLPPPPRVIERWAVVHLEKAGVYRAAGYVADGILSTRKAAERLAKTMRGVDTRIALLLIEEPE